MTGNLAVSRADLHVLFGRYIQDVRASEEEIPVLNPLTHIYYKPSRWPPNNLDRNSLFHKVEFDKPRLTFEEASRFPNSICDVDSNKTVIYSIDRHNYELMRAVHEARQAGHELTFDIDPTSEKLIIVGKVD